MSNYRAAGWGAIPDDLARSKAHHTAQLWYPALRNQQHYADTRGGNVLVAPCLEIAIGVAWTTVADGYFDSCPEEVMYRVRIGLALHSSSWLPDILVGARVTTATTAGGNSTTTTRNPAGRVGPPIDPVMDALRRANVRELAYPHLGEETLRECDEVVVEHEVDIVAPVLAPAGRRITVEAIALAGILADLPPLYCRSVYVVGYRDGL